MSWAFFQENIGAEEFEKFLFRFGEVAVIDIPARDDSHRFHKAFVSFRE